MKNPNRISKVNAVLFREVNNLLAKESIEKDLLISLTKIETSKDLRNSKVFFTVFPEKNRGKAKKFLDSKATDWQKLIGKKLTLKYKPKLNFFFDKGQQNAFKVEEILNNLSN